MTCYGPALHIKLASEALAVCSQTAEQHSMLTAALCCMLYSEVSEACMLPVTYVTGCVTKGMGCRVKACPVPVIVPMTLFPCCICPMGCDIQGVCGVLRVPAGP